MANFSSFNDFDRIKVTDTNGRIFDARVVDVTSNTMVLKKVISVGDSVKVVDHGHSYTTSLEWFNEVTKGILPADRDEYLMKFRYDETPEYGHDYEVLAISYDRNSKRTSKTIFLIGNYRSTYIIGEEGVELSE